MDKPILVTGAAGRVGAIGRTLTELLLQQGKPVRAMVHSDDARAQVLRDMGAQVVVGDLLDLASMHRVIEGCKAMYFGYGNQTGLDCRSATARRRRSQWKTSRVCSPRC